MTNPFSDLGIEPELITALSKLSIYEPTPIQSAAIPPLLDNQDAYLQAETGTGKTLAYLLPLYTKIDPSLPNCQAIVIAPTHELAIQIQRQCTDLSQHSGLPVRVLLLIGGTSLDRQLEKLKKKPHIVVGSLGRIMELIEVKKLKAHLVRTIVVDEADRMLSAENISDLVRIIKSTQASRNLVFVSATERRDTNETISNLCPNIVKIKTAATPVNSAIKHQYIVCEARARADTVRKLINAISPARSIVFVHKNEDAELIARKLTHHKLNVIDIHGALGKAERKAAMDKVRSGTVDVLVSSDVAARGLDIKGITHVINYDMPSDSDAYLHRIGRTGRAGASGVAVSLFTQDQLYLIDRYKKDLKITLQESFLREGKLLEVVSNN